MSVYYLGADDFGQEQGHLVTSSPGLLLVMFTSRNCKYCDDFMPEFKGLPRAVQGVNFGICNVDDKNRAVLQMARNSSTPITGVPKFILYHEGMPYVEYTGGRTTQDVLRFLKEIFTKLNHKRQFDQPRRTRGQTAIGNPPGGPGAMPPPQQQPLPARGQGGMQQKPGFTLNPSTGVKEFETSYGRPYNMLNDADFLAYESAYKQT